MVSGEVEGGQLQKPPGTGVVNAMQINVGDTVRLAPEITVEEFGLSLCDDDGTPIEIDLRGGSEHLSYAYLRWLFS